MCDVADAGNMGTWRVPRYQILWDKISTIWENKSFCNLCISVGTLIFVVGIENWFGKTCFSINTLKVSIFFFFL